ncbi:MAG: sodium:proton antiporter [Thermoanaerobaculum sp.]|nr:sodium:proton antiporter [Thermoanaerobaculum sp.]MDW7967250.1 sodium:proton antiporter [Thermoanaerobaculum sp.]
MVRGLVGSLLLLTAQLAEAASSGDLGTQLPAWSALPFAGILLSIALFPLLAPRFWHHHYPKVAAFWAVVLLIPFVAAYGGPAVHEVLHMAIADYIPFIILLGTLFTIGGGIYLRGSLRGSPPVNAAIMVIGTALASWIGTTGAAMLLIRPLLRANKRRRYRAHTVVFFIFLVANIGGSLTPLGDPPLFLGFLHGVPFFWTLTIWKEMLLVAGIVLGIYLILDRLLWAKESPEVRQAEMGSEKLRVEGWHNFFFLAGVLGAVIASGVLHLPDVHILGVQQHLQNLLRDGFLLLMAAASWLTTPRRVRQENEFSWEPIREVAILFAGIFATIIPPLAMLRAGEHGALGFIIKAVETPAHFFWATGLLSSFLDNAPTYLTFLYTALGQLYPGMPPRPAILQLVAENHAYLQAVATGAVFMGANTYIGNAPNFMVKSIAEEQGVPMPSFFGYIFKYTLPVLIPTFILATWVFFL